VKNFVSGLYIEILSACNAKCTYCYNVDEVIHGNHIEIKVKSITIGIIPCIKVPVPLNEMIHHRKTPGIYHHGISVKTNLRFFPRPTIVNNPASDICFVKLNARVRLMPNNACTSSSEASSCSFR